MATRPVKVWNGSSWEYLATQAPATSYQGSAPASPRVGDLWVDSSQTIGGNLDIPKFVNEAARDAYITSPVEGQLAYITAPTIPAATGGVTILPTGITTIYNGSVWVCTTEVGAHTTNVGTTTSASFTATLSGSPGTNPSVTLVTGTTAVVHLGCTLYVNVTANVYMGVAVSGAGTVAAGAPWFVKSSITNGMSYGRTAVITGLTAGTNTFTLQYQSDGSHTATFQDRTLTVKGVA